MLQKKAHSTVCSACTSSGTSFLVRSCLGSWARSVTGRSTLLEISSLPTTTKRNVPHSRRCYARNVVKGTLSGVFWRRLPSHNWLVRGSFSHVREAGGPWIHVDPDLTKVVGGGATRRFGSSAEWEREVRLLLLTWMAVSLVRKKGTHTHKRQEAHQNICTDTTRRHVARVRRRAFGMQMACRC